MVKFSVFGAMHSKYPKDFLAFLKAIKAKRPRTVINHILEHGQVTTEELQNLYGYEHPPRAARDVREHGVPLETFKVTNAQGRQIAAYRFSDPSTWRQGILAGRQIFSKEFKASLVLNYGPRCNICLIPLEPRALQIDHRVPYQVAGEGSGERNVKDFMLVCGSCNRSKSWSCEHCENWLKRRRPKTCKTCYWASPEKYKHVAMQELRRLDVTWVGQEAGDYDSVARLASQAHVPVGEFVKGLLKAILRQV